MVPVGSIWKIYWKDPTASTRYRLKYSMDNGITWRAIAPDFLTGTSYDWAVPMPMSNKLNAW
jgi:hypothetical protein